MKFLNQVLAGALALGLVSAAVPAQAFPDGPIEFVIPFGAGGGADIEGRLLAKEMSKVLGVPLAPVPPVPSRIAASSRSPVPARLAAATALRLDCLPDGAPRESLRRRDTSPTDASALVRKLASIPWCSVSSALFSLARSSP